MWAVNRPFNVKSVPALQTYGRRQKPLVLTPAFGGRNRKGEPVLANPAAKPVVWKMGLGPGEKDGDDGDVGYYRRPDNLRCNRRKNNGPRKGKQLATPAYLGFRHTNAFPIE